jgi:hypothetical protein
MPEDEKTPEVAQEITFPHTNVQIAKEGLLITNYLSPTFVTNQQLSSATMDAVVVEWQKIQRELQQPKPEPVSLSPSGIITPLRKGGKRHLN